ncbi:MAG: hypothetical protein H0V31_08005 [Acidobacteria bacterium]|nr:hypothetical protein [Acidobacteriota bacterium]
MRFIVKILFSIVLIIAGTNFVFGQIPTVQFDLETILRKAAQQTVAYEEEFRNLIAKETKTFEKYDKNDEIKKQNIIESNFTVIQSEKDNKLASEYRNILSVDGKAVPNAEKRSAEFFAQLKKSNSVEKELEKIQAEGSRYDKSLEISGLTLSPAVVLSDNLRPFFNFQLLGSENIQGNEVYLIGYQQLKKSPFILINEKNNNSKDLSLNYNLDLPSSVKKSDVFLRGKLWIDTKTFQLWREERELAARTENPFVLMKSDFEYQPSDYGILVPKQVSLTQYNAKNSKKNQSNAVKDTKVTFDYSRFTKSSSEVKILDDK